MTRSPSRGRQTHAHRALHPTRRRHQPVLSLWGPQTFSCPEAAEPAVSPISRRSEAPQATPVRSRGPARSLRLPSPPRCEGTSRLPRQPAVPGVNGDQGQEFGRVSSSGDNGAAGRRGGVSERSACKPEKPQGQDFDLGTWLRLPADSCRLGVGMVTRMTTIMETSVRRFILFPSGSAR